MATIFQLIIDGKLPCTKVYENERILAIEDIYPVAPVHVLIIPKKAIANIHSLEAEDWPLIGEMLEVAQKVAEDKGVSDGYRLVTNNGSDAGQTIFHLHFHLIGGKVLGPMA